MTGGPSVSAAAKMSYTVWPDCITTAPTHRHRLPSISLPSSAAMAVSGKARSNRNLIN